MLISFFLKQISNALVLFIQILPQTGVNVYRNYLILLAARTMKVCFLHLIFSYYSITYFVSFRNILSLQHFTEITPKTIRAKNTFKDRGCHRPTVQVIEISSQGIIEYEIVVICIANQGFENFSHTCF